MNVNRLKLSEELGYTPAAITHKLNGMRKLTLDDMKGICKVIGKPFDEATVDYLMEAEELEV